MIMDAKSEKVNENGEVLSIGFIGFMAPSKDKFRLAGYPLYVQTEILKNRAHHKYKRSIAMTDCLVILYPA